MVACVPSQGMPSQVRMVAWKTEGVKNADTFTDMNDLYIRAWMNEDQPQARTTHSPSADPPTAPKPGVPHCDPLWKDSDIHWRSKHGQGATLQAHAMPMLMLPLVNTRGTTQACVVRCNM